MSKHPTSELSPRDIAAMDYGCYHLYVLKWFKHRRTWGNSFLRANIKYAREARARIFRNCFDCEHCFVQAMYCCKPGEEPRELTWDYEEACTCTHYEERRGK